MGAVTREELHRLIDELPESEWATARRLLQALCLLGRDPRQLALDLAPLDDEPETEEERAAVAEGYEALARGEVISAEEAKRRLLA